MGSGRHRKDASSDAQSKAAWADASFETHKAIAETRGSGPVADASRPKVEGGEPQSGEKCKKGL